MFGSVPSARPWVVDAAFSLANASSGGPAMLEESDVSLAKLAVPTTVLKS